MTGTNPAVLAEAQAPEPERPTFEAIYREHAPYVWRTMRRMGVAERHLEDATQDVFCIVLRLLPGYEPRDRLIGWLAAIAANVAAQYRKREKQDPVASDVDMPERAANVEQIAGDRELGLRLLAAIEPGRRIVFILYHLDGMTLPEIARALKIREGTAATRLRRARQEYDAAEKRMVAEERRQLGVAVVIPLFGSLQWLDAERTIPPLSDGVAERMWGRLRQTPEWEAAYGGGGGRGTGRGAARHARTAGAVACALVLGVALGALWSPRQASRAPVEATAEAVATAAPSASPPAPTSAPSSSEPPPRGSAVLAPEGFDSAKEHSLIVKAVGALASFDPVAAPAAAKEHADTFRDGRYVEEREVISIYELIDAGRLDEARAQLDDLARRHPKSRQLGAIHRKLSAP